MRHFSCGRTLIPALLGALALCVSALASDLTVTVQGYAGESITMNDVAFDANHDFDGATTTYRQNLARDAVIFGMASGGDESVRRGALGAFGFENIRFYDYSRTSSSPIYQTGYYLATREITRGGQPCTLLLLGVHTNSDGDSWESNFDFLNQSITGSATDYNSTLALTFTKAADYILESRSGAVLTELDELQSAYAANGKDYLIWVCGASRGGAVGNYLAKTLIDRYGTGHVMAYLTGVPNVDKNALGPDNTSKYNSIFNILNPDDAITYLPFDRSYAGWGFARWGVDVYLRSPVTGAALLDAVQSRYAAYTAGATQYLDGTYHYFEAALANGAGLRSFIDTSASTVAASPRDYYLTPIAIPQYSSAAVLSWTLGGVRDDSKLSTTEKTPYAIAEQVLAADTSKTVTLLPLYGIAQGCYYNDCAATELLHFALLHALGAEDLDTYAKGVMGKTTDIIFYEAALAHTSESYLTLLSVYRDGVTIERDTLPDAAAVSEKSSGGVTVTSDKGFYGDQSFTATAEGSGYRLSLTYSDGTAGAPYAPATVSVPAGSLGTDARWAVFDNGSRVAILTPTYSDGCYLVSLRELSGTLSVHQDITATAALQYADGHSDSATYTPESVGTALPSDSRESDKSYDYTFTGWQFRAGGTIVKDGESETVTTMTLPLLLALNEAREQGKTVTAESRFSASEREDSTKKSGGSGLVIIGGGGGGGSSVISTPVQPVVTAPVATTPTVTTPAVATVHGFTDVKETDWYAPAVQYVAEKGLMKGVGTTGFAPNDTTTRAMLFTVLARQAGVDTASTTGEWYEAGMQWAVEQGISDGTSPTGNITREQLATMLYRVAVSKGQGFTDESASSFNPADSDAISPWASEGMRWCYGKGILTGDGSGALRPQSEATRAEVAKMLMVFCEALAQ